MRIAQTIDSGISPLEITFSVEDYVVNLVRWLWTFGDGSQSTEKAPKHTYQAPGLYTVACSVWDEFGNQYDLIKSDYIYVYDTTIGETGLLSGGTDFCFKAAVKAQQGQGITPVSGTWAWPPLLAGTARGIGANKENLSLVIDSETMIPYRIGVPEVWTDRQGGYDESEISCEAMLPEIKSRYGPHENVRIVEIHAGMVPYDERDYRGKAGHDEQGFRNGHTLSIEAYSGGEQIIPTTKLRSVQRDGDYVFTDPVEAKRVQLKFKYSTSCFRATLITCHAQELDHRTPPQLNDIPERQYQREFALPDLWFVRNKPTIGTNRADGIEWSGSGVIAAAPDGKSNGAFLSAGISGTAGYTTGDFIVSAWMIGDGTVFRGQVAGSGTVSLNVTGGVITFSDGTDTVQYTPSTSTTWRHIAVIRRGSSLEIYEAGALRMVQVLSGIRSYGGNCVVGVGSCFDIRRLPRSITDAAMTYYYESVLAGGGGFLP